MPAFSGTIAIWALRDGEKEPEYFAGTDAGFQDAIDSGLGGKVDVFLGAGELEHSVQFSTHNKVHVHGAGPGITTLKWADGAVPSVGPRYSGCTFINSAYGVDGTLRTGVGDSDISFSDLTIDGNEAGQGALDPGAADHNGINLAFVDGIRLKNVEVKNFLQTGIYLNASRKLFVDGLYLENNGAYGGGGYSQNGLALVIGTVVSGYGRSAVIKNVISDTVFDAHMQCYWSDVTYGNTTLRGGGKFGFEAETTSTNTAIDRIAIQNVIAHNLTQQFFTFGQLSGSGTTLSDVKIRNCECVFDATGHTNFAVRVGPDANCIVKRFELVGCTFTNCNSADQNNIPFFFHATTNATPSEDILVKDCTFNGGAPSSVVTGSHGIDIRGNVKRVRIEGNTIRDASGEGILVRTATASCNIDGLDIIGNYIYNSTAPGIEVRSTVASTTIKNANIERNYVEDACESTGTAGLYIGPTTGSSTMKNVAVRNNRVNQVSSTTMTRGLTLEAGGSSTSDSYYINGNDMINLGGGSDLDYASTGTHTNVHFDDPVVHGGDITAAATVTLRRGTLFHVAGATTITTINPSVAWERRQITLIFDSTAQVTDGSNLVLAGNFTGGANRSLVLRYDGTNMIELSRSTN